jgi:membrane-associated phospholipid phosphatase
MRTLLEWVTGLGDAALLLPASLLLLAYFAHRKAASNCLSWVAALAICGAVTIALKICFHACGAAVPFLDIRSPSGHASFSTTFYLTAGMVASADQRPWLRAATLLLAAALVIAIGITRVELHVHTPAEVVLGSFVGLGSAAWFAIGYSRHRLTGLDWRPIAGAVLGLAILTHGWHLSIEDAILAVARELRASVPACTGMPQSGQTT